MLDNFFKISKQEQTTLHKMLRAGMGWIMGGGRTPPMIQKLFKGRMAENHEAHTRITEGMKED
jgi:hypothetical protein